MLNLRPLNQFILRKHFKIETIQQVYHLIQPNGFLISIDLQDVFLHILIHQASREYMQFFWEGNLLHFKTPIRSLSESIGYSQKYADLSFAEHDARRFGYLLTYLITINKPQTETEQKTQYVLSKPKELGFISKFHLILHR